LLTVWPIEPTKLELTTSIKYLIAENMHMQVGIDSFAAKFDDASSISESPQSDCII